MVKHIKPTTEELDEGIKKSLEELDKTETPEESTVTAETTPDAAETVTEETAPVAETVVEPEPKLEVKPEPDYKEKFAAESKENIVLYAKSKKITEAVDQANEAEMPTDEELAKKYPEWDIMDDVQKRLIRESELSTKRFAIIHEATKEFRDIDAWSAKVDTFIGDPKTLTDYPGLDGKQESFTTFANKPSRRSNDFEILVGAFLYNMDVAKKVEPPKKGQMFETGSGGPNEPAKPKNDKISLAEAKVLRETNYSKYKEMLIAGKIADE
jgi:hypothetical protein